MRIFLSLGYAVYEVIITDLPQYQLPSWFASTQMKVKNHCMISNVLTLFLARNKTIHQKQNGPSLWRFDSSDKLFCYLTTTQHLTIPDNNALGRAESVPFSIKQQKRQTCVCNVAPMSQSKWRLTAQFAVTRKIPKTKTTSAIEPSQYFFCETGYGHACSISSFHSVHPNRSNPDDDSRV